MITEVSIRNFGKIKEFQTNRFSNINLIIGENGTGKTFLLKSMYAAVKTMEQFHRGNSLKSVSDLLAEKLRWTFQTNALGELVSKKAGEGLTFSMVNDGKLFSFGFSEKATVKLVNVSALDAGLEQNSVFIPEKEILSLLNIIATSRERDQLFGFDDTYYDLAKAVQIAPHRGKNFKAFSKSRSLLQDILHGRVDYDDQANQWYFRNDRNEKFDINITSEGTKKIAILDRLLANNYLSADSIIFIDEPEAALHPKALCQFLDILDIISNEMGIQIFIASHSYFTLKKLRLIALKRQRPVMCYSFSPEGRVAESNLQEGIPSNSIVEQSVQLYQDEVDGIL